MTLKLKNNYTNVEYTLTLSEIAVANNPNVYQLDIVMPSGADYGEYNYQLLNDDDRIVEHGILQYRPSSQTATDEYDTENEYYAYKG